MNLNVPGKSSRHANISAVSGADWWAQLLLPKHLFVVRVARKLKAVGRESFTLPDGSTWMVNEVLEGKQ